MAERYFLDSTGLKQFYNKIAQNFLRRTGGYISGGLSVEGDINQNGGRFIIEDGKILIEDGDGDDSLQLTPTGIKSGKNSADYVFATDGSVVSIASLTGDYLPLTGGTLTGSLTVQDEGNAGFTGVSLGYAKMSHDEFYVFDGMEHSALTGTGLNIGGNLLPDNGDTPTLAYYGYEGLWYGTTSDKYVNLESNLATFNVPVNITKVMTCSDEANFSGTLNATGEANVNTLNVSGDVTANANIKAMNEIIVGDDTQSRMFYLTISNDGINFYKNTVKQNTIIAPTKIDTLTLVADQLILDNEVIKKDGLLRRTADVEVKDGNGDVESTYSIDDAWAMKQLSHYVSSTSDGYSLITMVKMNHVDTEYRIAYIDVILEDSEPQVVTVNVGTSETVITGCALMKVGADRYRGAVTLSVGYQEDGTVDEETKYKVKY